VLDHVEDGVMKMTVEGAEELARRLDEINEDNMQDVMLAIATEMQNVMAPYPPPPPRRNPRRWYERGYGQRWMTRRGVRNRATSQMMNRRWFVGRGLFNAAEITNSAEYSSYVHLAEDQTKVHKRTGWMTEKTAERQLRNDGTIQRLVSREVNRIMSGGL
jgi:hypothetical protein